MTSIRDRLLPHKEIFLWLHLRSSNALLLYQQHLSMDIWVFSVAAIATRRMKLVVVCKCAIDLHNK